MLVLWACTSGSPKGKSFGVNSEKKSMQGNFKRIKSTGITDQEINSMHIDTNGDIYIGGETNFFSDIPVILKSSDFGKNWIESYSGNSGNIDFINSKGSFKYATCFQSKNREYGSELIYSQGIQDDWKKIELDGNLIMGVHFIDSLKCLIVTQKGNALKVYKSLDKGLVLKELSPPNYYFLYENLVSSESRIYGFYHPNLQRDSLGVFSLNILNGEYRTNILSSYSDIENKKLEIINENVIVTLFLDSVITRYKLENELSFEEVTKYKFPSDYQYVDCFFNDSTNEVLYVLNNRKEGDHFNSYYLGVSKDFGKTVDIIEESKCSYLKPYAYFDNKFIGYLRKGAFMIYEL
jgi:hypothetical protein